MYSIENKYLKLTVNPQGGAMTSIIDKDKNTELMYTPDPRSWGGTDVVIFPFIAQLENKTYTVDGKEYSLKSHGILRYTTLNISKITDNSISLYLESNEETLLIYPFKFYFEVTYTLIDKKLIVSYHVENKDTKAMYFSVGGHPALKATGIDNEEKFVYDSVSVEFLHDIKTRKFNLNETGNLIVDVTEVTIPRVINITKEIFAKEKTLIYDAKDISSVLLKMKDRSYLFDTSNANHLAIWSKPGFGDYVCVEPWWGVPDFEKPNKEISKKPELNSLESGKVFDSYYSITF